MRHLDLTERQESLVPVTRAELEALRTLAPFVTVHPAWRRGRVLVKCPGYVGEAHPPGLRVTVAPKFPLFMLRELANIATNTGDDETPPRDWGTSLGTVYAARLGRLIDERFAEGRLRDYHESAETAGYARGRIDFAELARQSVAQVGLPTVADEFTADRRENQAVVAAGRWLLERAAMRDRARGLLGQSVARYGAVEAVAPAEAEWAGLLASAKSPARVALLEWSRAVLAGRGAGHSGLWFRLELVFQQAVADEFRGALAESGATAESPQLTLTSPHGSPLLLKPDIVVRDSSGAARGVFDAKWKHLAGTGPTPRDLQQILAYQRILGGVSGGLIYPGVHRSRADYALPGGGSAGVYVLGLGRDSEFAAQCRRLARECLASEPYRE